MAKKEDAPVWGASERAVQRSERGGARVKGLLCNMLAVVTAVHEPLQVAPVAAALQGARVAPEPVVAHPPPVDVISVGAVASRGRGKGGSGRAG